MRLKQGQVWRCINEACAAQILVTEAGGLDEGSNPRCCCGSVMKMPYGRPHIRKTDTPNEVSRLMKQLSAVLR
jgi:hypothetical protein